MWQLAVQMESCVIPIHTQYHPEGTIHSTHTRGLLLSVYKQVFHVKVVLAILFVAEGVPNYFFLLPASVVLFWRKTKPYALQRQNTEISKQIFPEKEYRGLSPNFHIHASVSDLYIPTIGLLILLEEICRPILGLYKSITDTRMWKMGLRPRYSQKRNT